MSTNVRVAALGYHEVTDEPASSGFQRPAALPYKLPTRDFAAHLDRLGTAPVAPSMVDEIDFTQPGRYLLLTFDDGGKSAVHAGDALSRRGWRGHFFIVSSLIGHRTFLSASEIRYMRSCGHAIGSHSHTHPNIAREVPREAMQEEWRVSRDILAQLLSEPCLTASVPGGDISRATLQSAAAAGLRYVFTSEPWLTPWRVSDAWVFGRVSPRRGTSAAQVEQWGQFRGWTSALIHRQLKELAKRAVPPLYRLYVARRTRGQEGRAG